MEIANHNVFAQQTVRGKTLEQMTMHNERAFDNRMSQSAQGHNLHVICMDDVSAGQPGNPVTQSIGTSECARLSIVCTHIY